MKECVPNSLGHLSKLRQVFHSMNLSGARFIFPFYLASFSKTPV